MIKELEIKKIEITLLILKKKCKIKVNVPITM